MIQITIDFDDDQHEASLIAFGELAYRFDGVAMRHVEGDDTTDDEAAEDIGTILRGMQARMGHSNAGMRAIDQLLTLVNGMSEVPAIDVAPPRGIERPKMDKPTVRPTDSGREAQMIKKLVISDVDCPTCGRPAGRACGKGDQNYGVQHVHLARIEAWQQM